MRLRINCGLSIELSCVVDDGNGCEAFPSVYDAKRSALEKGLSPQADCLMWGVYFSSEADPCARHAFDSQTFCVNDDGGAEREEAVAFIRSAHGEDVAIRFTDAAWPDSDVPAAFFPKPPILPYGYTHWETLTGPPKSAIYVLASAKTDAGQSDWMTSIKLRDLEYSSGIRGATFIVAVGDESESP